MGTSNNSITLAKPNAQVALRRLAFFNALLNLATVQFFCLALSLALVIGRVGSHGSRENQPTEKSYKRGDVGEFHGFRYACFCGSIGEKAGCGLSKSDGRGRKSACFGWYVVAYENARWTYTSKFKELILSRSMNPRVFCD